MLFLQNNASSVQRAMELQYQFFDYFSLTGKPNCTGTAGDPFNHGDMELCAFEVGAWGRGAAEDMICIITVVFI